MWDQLFIHFGKDLLENLLHLQGNEPRFLRRPAHRLVAFPCTSSRVRTYF